MGLISDIIGGVAGIGQAAINAKVARENTDSTITANKAMAEYQYSKDLEMWNRQNDYNSPAAQMERFKSAGLNPNLIYGQGSPGNATQLPKFTAPTLEYNYKPVVDLPSTLSMFQDFQLRQAQVDNAKMSNEIKAMEVEAAKGYTTSEYDADNRTVNVIRHSTMPMVKRKTAEYQMEMRRYEAENKERMLDAQINNIIQNAMGKSLGNILQQKEINWYTAKNLSNIVAKGMTAIVARGLFKKAPSQIIIPSKRLRTY